jgi:hypothetical protein
MGIKSALVVISWWSNCLALTCLHNLARHAPGRSLYVLQVGKSQAQMERFRHYLPPADLAAEHGPVVEGVVRRLLPEHQGLWFLDHDWFALDPLEPWLSGMDRSLAGSGCCFCHPQDAESLAITSPAFWLAPARLPQELPSFAPVPYTTMDISKRPDLFRAPADLRIPDKDTLVLVREFLTERGLACGYSPQALPAHEHLGGIYLFANEILPEPFHDWVAGCVQRFTAFYSTCPPEWLEIESPILMARLAEFERSI